MVLHDVFYILSNVFLSHIICKFIHLFYEKCRFNKYLEFLAYFIYFILITFVFIYFGNPIITVSFNIVSIFLLTLMYDYVNLKKSSIAALLIYLFFLILESSVLITTDFNKSHFYSANQHNNINLLIIMYAISYVVCFFMIGLKKYYMRKLVLIFSSGGFVMFCVYPALSIILVLLNFIINNDTFLSILINLFILIFNILVFKYCDFVSEYFYNKVVMKFINDKVNKYKREIQVFKTSEDSDNFKYSNNSIIDSVLNSKIGSLSGNVNIKFESSIADNLKMSLDDLIIIVGNLADSAVMGINSIMDNKKRYIFIKVKYIRGIIFLKLKNSWDKKNVPKKITIGSEEQSHILFELSMQEIISKYDGTLNVKHNRNTYEINILIYDIKI